MYSVCLCHAGHFYFVYREEASVIVEATLFQTNDLFYNVTLFHVQKASVQNCVHPNN